MAAKKKNKKSAELLKENLLSDFPIDVSDSQVDIPVISDDEETLIGQNKSVLPPSDINSQSELQEVETAVKTWDQAVEKFGNSSESDSESDDFSSKVEESPSELVFVQAHEKNISLGIPGFDTGLEVENSSQLDLNQVDLMKEAKMTSNAKYNSKVSEAARIKEPAGSSSDEQIYQSVLEGSDQKISELPNDLPVAQDIKESSVVLKMPHVMDHYVPSVKDEPAVASSQEQNNSVTVDLEKPKGLDPAALEAPRKNLMGEATEVLGSPKTSLLKLDATAVYSDQSTTVPPTALQDSEKTLAAFSKAKETASEALALQATNTNSYTGTLSKSVPSPQVAKSSGGKANAFISGDASLVQAEALRMAQNRILELEKEVDGLRFENMELANATESVALKNEEQKQLLEKIEQQNYEAKMALENEVSLLRSVLDSKDKDVIKLKNQVAELENKLRSDFRKIRVRERELENRLDLLRAEKTALVKSKDEYILEQKRKVDQLSTEVISYRDKVDQLKKLISENQDQFKRTEKALRLALSNLEVSTESDKVLKKAQ